MSLFSRPQKGRATDGRPKDLADVRHAPEDPTFQDFKMVSCGQKITVDVRVALPAKGRPQVATERYQAPTATCSADVNNDLLAFSAEKPEIINFS